MYSGHPLPKNNFDNLQAAVYEVYCSMDQKILLKRFFAAATVEEGVVIFRLISNYTGLIIR